MMSNAVVDNTSDTNRDAAEEVIRRATLTDALSSTLIPSCVVCSALEKNEVLA